MADNGSQHCANGCGPMRRVAERDARILARKDFNREFDKRAVAEAEIDRLRQAIIGAIADAAPFGNGGYIARKLRAALEKDDLKA